jgi:hypothetical protein
LGPIANPQSQITNPQSPLTSNIDKINAQKIIFILNKLNNLK